MVHLPTTTLGRLCICLHFSFFTPVLAGPHCTLPRSGLLPHLVLVASLLFSRFGCRHYSRWVSPFSTFGLCWDFAHHYRTHRAWFVATFAVYTFFGTRSVATHFHATWTFSGSRFWDYTPHTSLLVAVTTHTLPLSFTWVHTHARTLPHRACPRPSCTTSSCRQHTAHTYSPLHLACLTAFWVCLPLPGRVYFATHCLAPFTTHGHVSSHGSCRHTTAPASHALLHTYLLHFLPPGPGCHHLFRLLFFISLHTTATTHGFFWFFSLPRGTVLDFLWTHSST